MKILTLNTGSSSLKYKLYEMQGPRVLAHGRVERVGEPEAHVVHQVGPERREQKTHLATHEEAAAHVLGLLTRAGHPPPLAHPEDLDGVGHRVVHGGEEFSDAVLVDAEVLARIEACGALAPLHAAPNLAGLRAARRIFPTVPEVAVFDTGFFQTLPRHAHRYAVPHEWYEQHRIRRYGFHGTSHRYVAGRAAELLGRPEPDLITLHLGNGCSAACVRGGVAVDTSMGLTPLEGLVMGTRSGDLDPAIVFHLARQGVPLAEIHEALERRSGLLGLSGISGDVRDVERAARAGNERADLALEVFVHRVRRYLGAFLLELGRCDAVVLTGGIGEHAASLRARILADLAPFGIVLDAARNERAEAGERRITADGSRTAAWVIPTDEELAIARETERLVGGAG